MSLEENVELPEVVISEGTNRARYVRSPLKAACRMNTGTIDSWGIGEMAGYQLILDRGAGGGTQMVPTITHHLYQCHGYWMKISYQ